METFAWGRQLCLSFGPSTIGLVGVEGHKEWRILTRETKL